MKLITILGTRPQIIRLHLMIRKLDQLLGKDHILVNTGQNFDTQLNDIFMKEFNVRKPNYSLSLNTANPFEQIGLMLLKLSEILEQEKPEGIFILGDTQTDLASALVARHFRKYNQKGLLLFHMEAGNRAFDLRVPEETNRRIVDHISTINLCYTKRAKENLVQEGLNNGYIVGNPMLEIIQHYQDNIEKNDVLKRLNLKKDNYFLVTLHRSENVDDAVSLKEVFKALETLSAQYRIPVIFSTHPRAKDKIEKYNIKIENAAADIRLMAPLGFFDFIQLEKNAKLVASDSGTVPEECAILQKPNLILREATERLELLEYGCSVLVGAHQQDRIVKGAEMVLVKETPWSIPEEYRIEDVSRRALSLILSYFS